MDCKIIEDLIMLYAEDLCSEDSKKMVEEHLKTCESCKKKLASYKKMLKAKGVRTKAKISK